MAWRVNPLSQTGFKVSPVKMGEKLLWGGSGPLSSSPFSSSCIPSDTILNTWAWGISMEMWARAMIYIRSPSCIAISWSYVRSDFWLLWKKRCHTPFFKKDTTLCHLHLFLSRLLKRHNFTARSSSTQLSAWLSDASQSD